MPEPVDVVLRLLEAVEARDWEAAGALLHPALTCEWPHSAELLQGADAWLELQRDYPEGWSLRVLGTVAHGDDVAAQVEVAHGADVFHCASFAVVRDGLVRRLTEYWTQLGGEEPPAWRAGRYGRLTAVSGPGRLVPDGTSADRPQN
jgi:hypothetical protein